jgi:hypothetical protein
MVLQAGLNHPAQVDHFCLVGTRCFTYSNAEPRLSTWELDAPSVSPYSVQALESTLALLSQIEGAIQNECWTYVKELQTQIPIPEFAKSIETCALRYNGTQQPCLNSIGRIKALIAAELLFHAVQGDALIDLEECFEHLSLHKDRFWRCIRYACALPPERTLEETKEIFCGTEQILPVSKIGALRLWQREQQQLWLEQPLQRVPELNLYCEKDYEELFDAVYHPTEKYDQAIRVLDLTFMKPVTLSAEGLPSDPYKLLDLVMEWKEKLVFILSDIVNLEEEFGENIKLFPWELAFQKAGVNVYSPRSVLAQTTDLTLKANKIFSKLDKCQISSKKILAFFQGEEFLPLIAEINALIESFNDLKKKLMRQKFKAHVESAD